MRALVIPTIVLSILCGAGVASAAAPSPSLDEQDLALIQDSTPDEGLFHDVQEGTYTIYPDSLPPCDEEDGTASSGGSPVDACIWISNDDGRDFIVIAP